MQNTVIGTIITLDSPQVAEMISETGFDWVMIDMEHSTLSAADVQRHVQTLRPGTLSIVRVPSNEEVWIKRVLDTGCDGVMVPMVLTREDAERAVRSMRYPTEGTRSVGVSRALKYGPDFGNYLFKESRELKLLVQIEHIEGVRNLDNIIKVEGISGIFIGPYDLSASLGMTGEVNSEKVQSEIRTIKSKCKEAGMPWGIFGMTPDTIRNEIADGCTYVLCGIDSVILSQQVQSIFTELKKELQAE
ncbi:MAG TPA: aldolase/citrate lyase family protein [Bacteroidales bacterium]|nr:aldolase/citrate lyase family protein [Bacteroidales bacterium]